MMDRSRRTLNTGQLMFTEWCVLFRQQYPDTKMSPVDVASPTGYEHSTHSSMATG